MTTLASWLKAAAVYRDPRVLAVMVLGFASGLPLLLTLSTLSTWLAKEGIDKTTIGLFASVGTPYALKFLWAPLVDRLSVPVLGRLLGRRRGWAVLTQLMLMGCILALGSSDPGRDPWLTALLALMVAFWSASQDIVVDAFRVELLEERQQGAGAGVFVLGYRLGMLASGAGALFVAQWWGWFWAHAMVAALMVLGILTVLACREPRPAGSAAAEAAAQGAAQWLARNPHLGVRLGRMLAWLHGTVVGPFTDFARRPGWLAILLFVLLYKFGDAVAGVMANPFYVELGFRLDQIAAVTKVFGLVATLAGGLLGGIIVNRLGIMRALLLCGVLQAGSNLVFAVQAMVGADLGMLAVTIATENITTGMGTVAFVAYLSSLCNVAYTATQYALLSSLMSVGRTILSTSGGWLADQLDWVSFFIVTAGAALPGLFLLVWMMRRFPSPAARAATA